jgi:hypothetical protein
LVDNEELPSTEKDVFEIDTIPLSGELVGVSSQGNHLSPYSNNFLTYTKGDIEVGDTHVKTQMQDKQIATWTLIEAKQVYQLNVEPKTKPKYLEVDAHFEKALAQEAEGQFWRYKDVFSWTYIDFKELLSSMAPHYLELEKDVLHVHHAHYQMTVHNANIVEQDVDKLPKAGFFKPVEEATWLSPIAIFPNKNRKLGIWTDYWMLIATPKNKMAGRKWIAKVMAGRKWIATVMAGRMWIATVMARRTWIAKVMAISPTRQKAHQKKWRFIKTKWKMYTRRRLKKKKKKVLDVAVQDVVEVDAQGIISVATQGTTDWAPYGTTGMAEQGTIDMTALGNTMHYMHGSVECYGLGGKQHYRLLLQLE